MEKYTLFYGSEDSIALSVLHKLIYTFSPAAAKSLQSCPTLRDPIDGSPPGSSAHGIYQARVLEWGAIAFSKVQCNPHQNHSCLFFVEIDQLTKIRKEIYP